MIGKVRGLFSYFGKVDSILRFLVRCLKIEVTYFFARRLEGCLGREILEWRPHTGRRSVARTSGRCTDDLVNYIEESSWSRLPFYMRIMMTIIIKFFDHKLYFEMPHLLLNED